jgi:transcriptional regulator with XRE-family HTH domain
MEQKIKLGNSEFTRGELARKSGVSLSHISRIFSGQREPSVTTVRRIAEAVGVSEQEVIDLLP